MFNINSVANMASSASSDKEAAEILARLILDFPTLELRNSDSLDFHEVHVTGIKNLILTAMKVGCIRMNKANQDIQR